jgi:putative ABC transport system ATP-binding protein
VSSSGAAGIRLSRVTKEYAPRDGPAVSALREVSLDISPGEFVSVEGPSGCGKTTLLNLVGLIDTPTSGDFLWDGVPAAALKERERAAHRLRRVGFIFQRFYLLPYLTARENVELPMRALRVPAPDRRARAQSLLDSVGLAARADAFPHHLSGGEEQRVAVARALANHPGLLLADEPTGELDSTSAQSVLALLRKAHADTRATVVVVTHNPTVAALAQRHLRMADGRVVGDSRRT